MTRRRPRSASAAIVVAGSLALFLVVFALLVFQLRAGRDPALRAVTAQVPAPPAKRILERRIVIRKVIVHVRPRADDEEAAPAVVLAAPATVTAAPPAAAPAPAPAPAPLVTRTS
jgi:hypothetical protein